MSDTVKLIVELPKEIYQDVIKNRYIYEEDVEYIAEAIRKATPLDDVKKEIFKLIDNTDSIYGTSALHSVLDILDNIGKESETN